MANKMIAETKENMAGNGVTTEIGDFGHSTAQPFPKTNRESDIGRVAPVTPSSWEGSVSVSGRKAHQPLAGADHGTQEPHSLNTGNTSLPQGVSNTPPTSYISLETSPIFLKFRGSGNFDPLNGEYGILDNSIFESLGLSKEDFVIGAGPELSERCYKFGGVISVAVGFRLPSHYSVDHYYTVEIKLSKWGGQLYKSLGSSISRILELGGICIRFDLAIDDFSGRVPFAEMLQKIRFHYFASKDLGLSSVSIRESGRGVYFVIGSRQSIQLSVFDCSSRLATSCGNCETGYWVRYELRFSYKFAVEPLKTFIASSQKGTALDNSLKLLFACIDLKENSQDPDSETWKTWKDFASGLSAVGPSFPAGGSKEPIDKPKGGGDSFRSPRESSKRPVYQRSETFGHWFSNNKALRFGGNVKKK